MLDIIRKVALQSTIKC